MLRKATMMLAVTASALALAACSATMKQTEGGSYLYEGGRLESIEGASLEKVWQASLDAMKDLQFAMSETRKDALQGRIKADQADGSGVTVSIERVEDNSTRVMVRAGSVLKGDESVGEMVLKNIRKRIKTPLPPDQAGKAIAEVQPKQK